MAHHVRRSLIRSAFLLAAAAGCSEEPNADGGDRTGCIPLAGRSCPSAGSAPSSFAGTGGAGVSPSGASSGRGGLGGRSGGPAVPTSGGIAGAGPVAGSGAGATAMPATSGDVPASEHCAPVADWPADWGMFETEVLRLVNINRAMGWDCGAQGVKAAAGPLTMDPALRCSARLHSQDMAARMFFAHDNPDGQSPSARMSAAGYSGGFAGENIARGQRTPEQVVAGWMDSDGHCSNIMSGNYVLIGVGYAAGMAMNSRFNSELYWTQNFGSAPRPRR